MLDQDAANLPGVQAGMHSAAFKGLWIGAQELRIRHFHKVIDDYIYGPGKQTARRRLNERRFMNEQFQRSESA